MKNFFPLVIVMLVSLQLHAQQTTYTGTINKLSREWTFYIPKDLPPSRPLVFYLSGCCASYKLSLTSSGYNSLADTAKVVVCYPSPLNTPGQYNNQDWDVGSDRDLVFILALIDTAVARYAIDRSRVYATGMSMGGFMSNYLGCSYPDVFAAIAPSAGCNLSFKRESRDCKTSRPVPGLHMHGTNDQVILYSDGVKSVASWVKLNGCPETPRVTNNYKGSKSVKMEYYGPCADSSEVVFLSAEGMGHTWMAMSSEGVSAASEGWNFMKKFSIKAKVNTLQQRKRPVNSTLPMIAGYSSGAIHLLYADNSNEVQLFDPKGCTIKKWAPGTTGSGVVPLSIGRGMYFLQVTGTFGSVVLSLVVN